MEAMAEKALRIPGGRHSRQKKPQLRRLGGDRGWGRVSNAGVTSALADPWGRSGRGKGKVQEKEQHDGGFAQGGGSRVMDSWWGPEGEMWGNSMRSFWGCRGGIWDMSSLRCSLDTQVKMANRQ